jgi:hypothetical protein
MKYFRHSRLAYYGYDMRMSYGPYTGDGNAQQHHYREMLLQFNRTLKAARELEKEGRIKVLEIKNDEIECRYFIYWDDNSDYVHRALVSKGGMLGRGVFTENEEYGLPNQINGLSSEGEFEKHRNFMERHYRKLPLKIAEKTRRTIEFFNNSSNYC